MNPLREVSAKLLRLILETQVIKEPKVRADDGCPKPVRANAARIIFGLVMIVSFVISLDGPIGCVL